MKFGFSFRRPDVSMVSSRGMNFCVSSFIFGFPLHSIIIGLGFLSMQDQKDRGYQASITSTFPTKETLHCIELHPCIARLNFLYKNYRRGVNTNFSIKTKNCRNPVVIRIRRFIAFSENRFT
jgi:hypothetical protein